MRRTPNTTINCSKEEKNNERYTQLSDIEGEVLYSPLQSIGNEPPYELEYDIDGGMATDWEWDFEYDAADRLSSVSPTFLEDGALRVLNEYDYRNRRIRKIVQRLTITLPPPPSPPIETHTWNTIETRTFVYDDWNLIHETIREIDGGTTNVTEVQYFWGLDLSDTLHGAGGVGGLLAVSRNGQFYFPTYDNNGNVTKYIDESDNVVAAYEYDDFGRLISQSGPLADFFRLRFSTKYYDPETCLYYYGERFYSPYWRIWLNRDPIEEEGGLNLYLICDNGTLCNIDMLGFNRYMTTFAFNWEQLHVGVAVDDWVCSGGKWKKNGVVTFDFAPQDNWWGRSMTYVGAAKGVIIESPGMTLQQHHVIFSSPEEDISMIKKIREEMKNPPRYNFFFNNCIKWALKAIEYGREYE
jgi:RHS repeat-associated protein